MQSQLLPLLCLDRDAVSLPAVMINLSSSLSSVQAIFQGDHLLAISLLQRSQKHTSKRLALILRALVRDACHCGDLLLAALYLLIELTTCAQHASSISS